MLYFLKLRVPDAPFVLNLDWDHYINNSNAISEATRFLMDPQLGKKLCYVQFTKRFEGVDNHDRYANHSAVFFDGRDILINSNLSNKYRHNVIVGGTT